MDASELICRAEFFYADCIAVNSARIIGFKKTGNDIEIDDHVLIAGSASTDIFQNFSVEVDGSRYVGGEASAHGSCGFFFKKTGDALDWALMSLDSNPFIEVEVRRECVRFTSGSGVTWVVPEDDITKVHIER